MKQTRMSEAVQEDINTLNTSLESVDERIIEMIVNCLSSGLKTGDRQQFMKLAAEIVALSSDSDPLREEMDQLLAKRYSGNGEGKDTFQSLIFQQMQENCEISKLFGNILDPVEMAFRLNPKIRKEDEEFSNAYWSLVKMIDQLPDQGLKKEMKRVADQMADSNSGIECLISDAFVKQLWALSKKQPSGESSQ